MDFDYYFSLYICMFLVSLLLFGYCYNSVFMMLLMMEYMMFSLLLLIYYIMFSLLNVELIMYYLVFVVCESVFGLTILVLMIRSSGTNMIKSMNLMMW